MRFLEVRGEISKIQLGERYQVTQNRRDPNHQNNPHRQPEKGDW
jgi:hypothetical protein